MELKKINISEIKGKYTFERVFGLKKGSFDHLLSSFIRTKRLELQIAYEERKAIYATWPQMTARFRRCNTDQLEHDLLVLLYYLRHYPSYELLAFHLNQHMEQVVKLINKTFKLLHKTLKELGVLPSRNYENAQALAEDIAGRGVHVLVDVTERRVHRHKNYEAQKADYSGKKKAHTVKNTIFCTLDLYIFYLGVTFSGANHDFNPDSYREFKEEFGEDQAWFEKLELWLDLGYQGVRKRYGKQALEIHIPIKKPRKSKKNPNPKLSDVQKQHNKEVSSIRIRVEHAIGKIKIFKILSDVFRGKKMGWDDELIEVVVGIHNFKLTF